jgi:hypothetical protein
MTVHWLISDLFDEIEAKHKEDARELALADRVVEENNLGPLLDLATKFDACYRNKMETAGHPDWPDLEFTPTERWAIAIWIPADQKQKVIKHLTDVPLDWKKTKSILGPSHPRDWHYLVEELEWTTGEHNVAYFCTGTIDIKLYRRVEAGERVSEDCEIVEVHKESSPRVLLALSCQR